MQVHTHALFFSAANNIGQGGNTTITFRDYMYIYLLSDDIFHTLFMYSAFVMSVKLHQEKI